MLGTVLPLTALAQPPPGVPTPEPRSGNGVSRAPTTEPPWRLEGGIIVGTPRGDLDRENTSIGFGLDAGRTIAGNVGLFAGYRYIKISSERASADDGLHAAGRYVMRHYDLMFGARYSWPVLANLKLFGEAHLDFATLTIGHPEFASGTEDPSSLGGSGFGVRAGVLATVRHTFGIGGSLSYSWASIKIGDANLGGPAVGFGNPTFADNWMTFEAFAYVAF